ncbi:hypothetical protein MATL_G00240860 [Megalops atlanticus]|uniref:Uncharacterized protein n=1 Tax=Megalops atlanticus TaxID=7932 RepID=A0A9D3PCC1_MEGAT|nr:hypothetical protein MATL_G00240860 [Megalops atlanticus]
MDYLSINGKGPAHIPDGNTGWVLERHTDRLLRSAGRPRPAGAQTEEKGVVFLLLFPSLSCADPRQTPRSQSPARPSQLFLNTLAGVQAGEHSLDLFPSPLKHTAAAESS